MDSEVTYIQQYADFIRGFLHPEAKVRVVFDTSNGAAGPVLENVFRHKDIQAHYLNSKPDGGFPAHGPNPLAPGVTHELSETVKSQRADLGVIFDCDGDRVLFLDEIGRIINPYDIFTFLKAFSSPPYVVDVRALAEFTMPGTEVIEEKVGRYFIIKAMYKSQAGLGAEYSGHYYFDKFFYSDSGILAAVLMVNFVSRLKCGERSLSLALTELGGRKRAPEINFPVGNGATTLKSVENFYRAMDGIKTYVLDGVSVFGKDFAFNLRASVTEPLLRLNLAADSKAVLEERLAELKKMIEQ